MHSLSARLLVLTIIFVMVAEVFIFAPSVGRFRENYLMERIGNAHLAILALDATPDGIVSDQLKSELLAHVDAYAISVRRGGMRLTLMVDGQHTIDKTIMLHEETPLEMIGDALATMATPQDRMLRVVSPSPKDSDVLIEVLVREAPLAQALLDFGWRIFLLSIVISLITAGLVFGALHWLLVRPLRKLADNMMSFQKDPEDGTRVIKPSGRRDEVGQAERELASMQQGLRAALQQKEHLAALGTAVAKINHDLKGILSRAILVFDRLEESEDPEVRRIAPTLISAIDRAVAMCSQTLNYVGQETPSLTKSDFELEPLLKELTGADIDGVDINANMPAGMTVTADRDQFFRAVGNLVRNAVQAGAQEISVSSHRYNGVMLIDISDNGPGLPPRAQENLFKPFKGSTKSGGTGLGLAIARELIRGHGGDLELESTSGAGTTFRIILPDSPPA